MARIVDTVGLDSGPRARFEPMSSDLPRVSIVIPVLNEERHLREVVAAALAQDYEGELEVVVAVGPSRDRTMEIARELAAAEPRVVVVANPSGRTPDAMNAGIAAAQGSVVVRCDGHAMLPKDYVATAVSLLERTGAANVGGVMDAQGETDFQRAVAWAMKSRVGVGAAAFHVGGGEGEAETVYLGCFRAEVLRQVGGYDSRMTRAQDWELNHRIRAAGGKVWFSPRLRVTYRPRRDVRSLSRQYLEYGRWRRQVMRMHPETSRRWSALRYFAPPVALLANLFGLALGLVGLTTGTSLVFALAVPAGYAAALLVIAAAAARSSGWQTALRLPLVLATMHLSWGWGFLTSPANLAR